MKDDNLMKKTISLILASFIMLTMVSCGAEHTSTTESSTQETTTETTVLSETTTVSETTAAPAAKGWDDAAIADNLKEDFQNLTAGVPKPHVSYTVHVVSTVSGLMFDFPDEESAATWKQIIQIEGDFRYVEEKFGVIYYENDTHTIQISGYSITIKLK